MNRIQHNKVHDLKLGYFRPYYKIHTIMIGTSLDCYYLNNRIHMITSESWRINTLEYE